MSSRIITSEFQQLTKRWAGAHGPVSGRELDTWLRDWQQVLGRVRYFRMQAAFSLGEQLGRLVSIRGAISIPEAYVESAKMDLERLWAQEMADGMKAAHAFEEATDGFTFHFAALNKNEFYVTGALRVRTLTQ